MDVRGENFTNHQAAVTKQSLCRFDPGSSPVYNKLTSTENIMEFLLRLLRGKLIVRFGTMVVSRLANQ